MKILAVLIVAISGAMASNVYAMPCEPSEGRSAWLVEREVAGNRDFRELIERPEWVFHLQRADHGWDIRLRDKDGVDLTQMTPPLRGAVNPRQIYGWHFRNADNTGANEGDVNAPQGLRLFGFDPALSGTGGYKGDGVSIDAQPGRGALTIKDMGLADLEPGEKARINYLKFNLCMTWPKTDLERQKEAAEVAAMTELRKITPELIEMMGVCGLDYRTYQITPFLTPVELGGDFDGDDAHDQAVPIVRKADEKRGLFLCRAGTWGEVVGMEGQMGAHLTPGYFENIDWWSIHRGPVGQGVGEGSPPTLKGDAIVIGKEGASSAMIYWTGTEYTGYWQGD